MRQIINMGAGKDTGLKMLIKWIVYSNFHLSLGAAFVAYASLFILRLPFDPMVLFIPFAGTMFIYNLNRHTDSTEDLVNVPERKHFITESGRNLLIAGMVLYLIALFVSAWRNLPTFFIVLLPCIIAVFYSIFRLKKYYILKNLLVASAWGMTPLVAGFYFGTFNLAVLTLSILFALALFINTVIFDIKDTRGDYLYKISTLPTVIGAKSTRHVCMIVNLFSFMTLLLSIASGILPLKALVLVPFLAYIFAYIMLSAKRSGVNFYGLTIDGEFAFLAVMVFLASLVLGW